MAVYDFTCHVCEIIWEEKMSFKEHDTKKHEIKCPKCNGKATQIISKVNFKLLGEGWFGPSSEANANPYAITQRELNGNLDKENAVEDIAGNLGEMESII